VIHSLWEVRVDDEKKERYLFDWDDEDVEDAPTVVMPHRQPPPQQEKKSRGFLEWFFGEGID